MLRVELATVAIAVFLTMPMACSKAEKKPEYWSIHARPLATAWILGGGSRSFYRAALGDPIESTEEVLGERAGHDRYELPEGKTAIFTSRLSIYYREDTAVGVTLMYDPNGMTEQQARAIVGDECKVALSPGNPQSLTITPPCTPKHSPAPEQRPSASTEPPKAPPEPAEPTLTELIMVSETLRGALAISRPFMTDSTNEISDGAILFAQWASTRMTWNHVFVEKDETSLKLVKKDSDSARGKRMCYSGRVVQISKDSTGPAPLFVGLLRTNNWDILHFIAAGSTGNLVEDSRARFCGVVTGRYSYSNAGGGTTHAVQMVGMFKLPENMKAQ